MSSRVSRNVSPVLLREGVSLKRLGFVCRQDVETMRPSMTPVRVDLSKLSWKVSPKVSPKHTNCSQTNSAKEWLNTKKVHANSDESQLNVVGGPTA